MHAYRPCFLLHSMQYAACPHSDAVLTATPHHVDLQAWLRVHTGYHTAPQTVAGFVLGSTSAVCWLKLYDGLIAEWCRQEAWHFDLMIWLAAAAAAAFVLKLIRKPKH